jgi:uncharacterized protein with NAD-binding domain and iron-sulfur cluster
VRATGKKVVVLGGGIAGMSVAHELIERGFAVEVLERRSIAGGKASSVAATPPLLRPSPFAGEARKRELVTPSRPALPGEHGFRFFPGFYRHIVDTMAEIPYGSGSVADNLVDAAELRIASFDRPAYSLPARFPRSSEDLKVDVFAVIAVLSGQAGVPLEESLFFATTLWQFLTSCEERRFVEYERVNWWDFIEAGSRSLAYQRVFGNAITRSLVAAKAQRASAKTIGDIFMQIVFDILLPGVAADRVLDGPTNDVWIDPWLESLRERGVEYHQGAAVRAIRCERGAIRSVSAVIGGRLREITGDYFVGALPVERMAELLSPAMLEQDPSLASLHALTEYVEWMNGIQYYLTEDVRMARGHVIYIDSPWALTSISQPQFWQDVELSKHGDGTVRGLLSVDISDWDVPGLNGKEAQHCSREEIALETWEQIKRSINVGGEVLRDSHLHSWFLDPAIDDVDADGDPATPRIDTNAEPLLVNYVDTWRLRPEAVTRIPNFFLASDYVRTFTDLATMEAANEAARRAANGVLRAARVDAEPSQIWNLHEPEVLVPFRALDRVRYRRGQAWDGRAIELTRSVLSLVAIDRSQDSPPPGEPEAEAAEARASSDGGLRRLRIVAPSR